QGAATAVETVEVAALSTTGPLLLIAGELMMLGIAIDQFVSITEARPRLVKGLDEAQKPITQADFLRITQTKSGMGSVIGYWTSAVSGSHTPDAGFSQRYKTFAQAAVNPAVAVTASAPSTTTSTPARFTSRTPVR